MIAWWCLGWALASPPGIRATLDTQVLVLPEDAGEITALRLDDEGAVWVFTSGFDGPRVMGTRGLDRPASDPPVLLTPADREGCTWVAGDEGALVAWRCGDALQLVAPAGHPLRPSVPGSLVEVGPADRGRLVLLSQDQGWHATRVEAADASPVAFETRRVPGGPVLAWPVVRDTPVSGRVQLELSIPDDVSPTGVAYGTPWLVVAGTRERDGLSQAVLVRAKAPRGP